MKTDHTKSDQITNKIRSGSDKKHTRKKKTRKEMSWITSWLLIAMFMTGFSVLIVRSAYLGYSEVKRVVSTREVSHVVFSSNVMKAPEAAKNIYVASDGEDYEVAITVCNFEQMFMADYAKEQIIYDLTAELVQFDGTGYVSVGETLYREDGKTIKMFGIRQTGDNNQSVTNNTQNINGVSSISFNGQKLPGGGAMTDTFMLVFDGEEAQKEISEYFIRVTATPKNSNEVNGTVQEIGAVIGVSKGKTYAASWKGIVTETDESDYDAYNLQVTGSGSGIIDISWNSNYFAISDMFLMDTENHFVAANGTELEGNAAILSGGTGWSKVRLKVDSANQDNYEIQFFKTQGDAYKSDSGYQQSGISALIKADNYRSDN